MSQIEDLFEAINDCPIEIAGIVLGGCALGLAIQQRNLAKEQIRLSEEQLHISEIQLRKSQSPQIGQTNIIFSSPQVHISDRRLYYPL
jgi:hypothetical protein